ncbi:hypothetical protein ACI8AC_23685 [Geodermatophilus sp. SYSU D00758]
MAAVRLLEERRFDPPRPVLVEHDQQWWPGWPHAWRLCDDGRGWRADVEYVITHEWGRGKHVPSVPATRLRLP